MPSKQAKTGATLFATAVGLLLVIIPEPASTATGLAILATTFAVNAAGKK